MYAFGEILESPVVKFLKNFSLKAQDFKKRLKRTFTK